MKKSVIILYTGNVCSTPLVLTFRRIAQFRVPVREELDDYLITKNVPDRSKADVFVEALSDIHNYKNTDLLRKLKISLKSNDHKQYFAMKWRPFLGDDIEQITAQQKIFDDINSVPFILVRKSLIHQCTKIVLNEKHYATRWPQFAAAKFSDEQYADYLEKNRQVRLSLNSSEINKIIGVANNIYMRTQNNIRGVKRLFAKPNCNVIYSEDLYKPLLDEGEFMKYFTNKLNIEISHLTSENVQKPLTRKAGLELENLINAEEVLNNKKLNEMEDLYHSALSEV